MRLLFLLLLLTLHVPVVAQPFEAPAIPAAESAFDRGLRAYETGQYDAAARAFRKVTEGAFNQRTTAAHLMLGKAHYAAGEFADAIGAMTDFVREYPRSRYLADARALRIESQARLDAAEAVPEATDVGVVLPTNNADIVFSQALFNGVRLAVEAHNAAVPERPVRMVFRNTEGSERGAVQAVESLSRAGVELVLGPLYSEEATAAGGVAERERLLLVAPLATNEAVSEGRRYVFQANPTYAERGRAMARYAAAQRPGTFGVVAQSGTIGETMAEAFQTELIQVGGTVAFTELLFDDRAWFRLDELLADSLNNLLADVDALYLPVSGADADEYAAGALRSLDRAVPPEERGRLRVFGNLEWGMLDASRPRAEGYGTVFTSDFHLGERDEDARAFAERYRALAGVAPERLAYAGYDLAQMVLALLAERRSEESLPDLLRRAAPYAGLGHRIDFGRGNANEAMFILGYRDGEVVVVE
ncbi:MAG: ABC transporter substrate-binding protein [Bacteroidota bacterium]